MLAGDKLRKMMHRFPNAVGVSNPNAIINWQKRKDKLTKNYVLCPQLCQLLIRYNDFAAGLFYCLRPFEYLLQKVDTTA